MYRINLLKRKKKYELQDESTLYEPQYEECKL